MKLTLNDLSVLLPLPADADAPGYLVPWSSGTRGELLPQAVFDQIPTFPVKPSQGLNYARMRTLALRFDACSPTADGGCAAQIRLVMQPLGQANTALDSALHLFYSLTDVEMAEVVAELRALRAYAPEVTAGPLDVHPAVVAQGIQGEYGWQLTDMVLRYAGEQNLTRMTFFLRAPPLVETWFFGGFDRNVSDGVLTVMNIVGVGQGNQRVIRNEVEGGYDFLLTPEGNAPEDGSALFTTAAADAATPDERTAAFASYLRVENPKIYSPEALPCAGCHLSAFVTAQARERFGLADDTFPDDLYTSAHDLTLRSTAPANASSLRAFGWFGDEPMISQRVINSTAEICDDIEARYPAE